MHAIILPHFANTQSSHVVFPLMQAEYFSCGASCYRPSEVHNGSCVPQLCACFSCLSMYGQTPACVLCASILRLGDRPGVSSDVPPITAAAQEER